MNIPIHEFVRERLAISPTKKVSELAAADLRRYKDELARAHAVVRWLSAKGHLAK